MVACRLPAPPESRIIRIVRRAHHINIGNIIIIVQSPGHINSEDWGWGHIGDTIARAMPSTHLSEMVSACCVAPEPRATRSPAGSHRPRADRRSPTAGSQRRRPRLPRGIVELLKARSDLQPALTSETPSLLMSLPRSSVIRTAASVVGLPKPSWMRRRLAPRSENDSTASYESRRHTAAPDVILRGASLPLRRLHAVGTCLLEL
jgi:hypothetical protein